MRRAVVGSSLILEQEKQSKPILRDASEALATFKQGRRSDMATQMEVCWLRDHFRTLIQDEIASLIDIPQSLVNRYGKLQEKQRDYVRRQRQEEFQGATIAAATIVAA